MRLHRREILEQLVRLGLRNLSTLKTACREYEAYWENLCYSRGLGTMLGPVYTDFTFSYVYTKSRNWDNTLGDVNNPGGGRITGEFENYHADIIGSNITYKF
jgi:hypothetical protein